MTSVRLPADYVVFRVMRENAKDRRWDSASVAGNVGLKEGISLEKDFLVVTISRSNV